MALSDRIFPARPNAPAEQRQASRLEPVYDWVVGETRPSLLLLGGVAVLLLVITCATVSGALLVRVTRRQREMALRAALGADHDVLALVLDVADGFIPRLVPAKHAGHRADTRQP